jgi:E3 SUMO-protein ligase PIAS1
LESAPDTVEDVIVEANGEWHTVDDKYASPTWKGTHKPAPPVHSPTPHPNPGVESTGPSDHVHSTSSQEKQQNLGDVFVLDSEEEDEGEVKRELSPSRRERSLVNGLPSTQVIDLTIESDDENASVGSLEKKRKAEVDVVPAEEVWKKSRIGDSPNGATTTRTVNGNVNNPTADVPGLGNHQGARRFVSLPQRTPSHGGQYTATPHAGSPYTTPYYGSVSTGSFGSQATTHRTGYYSQFGNG